MLSRLIITRAGSNSSLLSGDVHGRLATALSVIRCVSNTTPVSAHAPAAHAPVKAAPKKVDLQQTLREWEAAHKIYFGPERDTVNFPIKTCPATSPPVRLGFVPETWFAAMYDKTGVTGPYVFGAGMVTFLLSKELWIVEHGFFHALAFWLSYIIISKKWGKSIAQMFDETNDKIEDRQWTKPIQESKKYLAANVEEIEKAIWREEGQKYIFEAKKENVDLQLESVYRQRLNEAHQAVKKRLDYAMDVQSSTRRIQQEHMVQWIVDSVQKSITPQQEKDSLTKCIADLKAIAAKHAAAA